MKNLIIRTLSGAVLAVVVLGAIRLGPWSYALLLLAILVGGMWEFYRMARLRDARPHRFLGLLTGIVLFVCTFLAYVRFLGADIAGMSPAMPFTILLLYLLLLVPTLIVCELFRSGNNPFADLGTTFTGVLYAALPLSLLLFVPLLLDPATAAGNGWRPWPMVCFILVVWANDVFAYLVGSSLGRHPLCKRISPNKSWEGFFGGIAGAVGVALAASWLLGADMGRWAGLAVVASLTGVAGDLVESKFKRAAGVKDSGRILPGHGGWLDRFDAMILSAPYVLVYLILVK